jgi:hypothetical protein
LDTKFTAVEYLAEGQFLRARENWVTFLVLGEGTLRSILSIKQGQNCDRMKVNEKIA